MIFMCLIFNSLKQENTSNTLQVGYYTGENAVNEKIIERLKEVSGYNYIAYESEHELKNDIIKEKILCGFRLLFFTIMCRR